MMSYLHLVHKIKSYLIDRRPKGFGKILKLIDWIFFQKLPEGEILLKTLYGFPPYINPRFDKGIEKKIYLTGSYEKGLLHLIDVLIGPEDIVVDAGANIGLISIFCGQKVGKHGLVLAFEPHPETAAILRRNIELNHLNQVKVFEQALGSEKGTAKIYSNLHINRGAASMVDFQEGSSSFEIQVDVLDQVLLRNKLHKVNLLKVDVEGFEMEVLKGAKELLASEDGPILVVECSITRQNYHYSMSDLYSLLTEKYGYAIFRFEISKEKISRLKAVNSVDDLPKHDNIVAFKPLGLDILKKTKTIF